MSTGVDGPHQAHLCLPTNLVAHIPGNRFSLLIDFFLLIYSPLSTASPTSFEGRAWSRVDVALDLLVSHVTPCPTWTC
jgi:hypothetical protein